MAPPAHPSPESPKPPPTEIHSSCQHGSTSCPTSSPRAPAPYSTPQESPPAVTLVLSTPAPAPPPRNIASTKVEPPRNKNPSSRAATAPVAVHSQVSAPSL